MYRIYRDTRFSDNKAPLKTHVAAVFPPRGLPKHQGAGLYFHIALDGVWVGGGMYAPDTSQLPGIVSVFRQIAPLVAFLNEPLLKDGLSRSG